MTRRALRVVFFGTAEFAVPCLSALLDTGHAVLAVVTQPDKPQGRGRHVAPSRVKSAALAHGLPVLQPRRVRSESFIAMMRELSPDVLARHGHHPLVFSTPWVALGLGRYLKLALRDGAGSDPSALAVSDAVLLLSVVGWLLALALILYR